MSDSEEDYPCEWVRDYEGNWQTDPAVLGGRACSQKHCKRPAVAVWERYSPWRSGQTRRQFCCDLPSHLYERRIVNGEVQVKVAVGSPFWKKAKGRGGLNPAR